jgi:HEAT repeat protein
MQLMTATSDAEPRVRRQAVRLLGEIEPTFSAVIGLLVLELAYETDEQVRAHAAMALRRHPAEALPHLVKAARHAVWNQWWEEMHAADEAAAVLVQIGGKAVPAIIDGVDRGILSQFEAMVILLQMDGDVAAPLLAAAEHATTKTRGWIVREALTNIRNAAETARRDSPDMSSSDGDDRVSDRGPLCRAFGRLLAKKDVRADILRAGLECSVVARAATFRLAPGDRDSTSELLSRAPQAFLAPAARKIVRAFRRGELPEETLFKYLDILRYRGNNETSIRSVLAEQAVPLLRAGLRDLRAPSRQQAAEALRSWDDAAWSAAPDLVAALSDPDETVRTAAAAALSSFSRRTPTTLSSILPLLAHHDAGIRSAAVRALSSSTSTLPANAEASVVLLLSDPEWNVRSAAAGTLASFAALHTLLPLVTASNCWEMAHALEGSAIVPTSEILPALDRAIRICDSEQLIRVMARSGPAAEPWLQDYARNAGSNARIAAIEALAATASPALPAVRQAALLDGPPKVFAAALKALRSDASDEEVRLIASVIDGRVIDLSDPALRIVPPPNVDVPPSPEEQSIGALRTIGRRGRDAAPAVWRQLARQETPSLEAVATLFAIQPDARSLAAVETAFAVLNDEHSEVYAREKFIGTLAAIPDLAHQWLLPLLRSSERLTVITALEILAQSAPPRDVVPYVSPLLSHPDPGIRKEAVRVLGLFADDPDIRDRLLCLASDPAMTVRFEAARALADRSDDVPAEIETILAEQFVTDEMNRTRFALASALHSRMPGVPPFNPPVPPPGWRPPTPPDPRLPEWPLPPPLWSAYDTIPSAALGNAGDTLEGVHKRLADTLRRLGYATQGIFAAPGGFALMTMVERIYADGKPYRAPERWTTSRVQPRSLREYLEILFVEKPGRFRVFVFVITPRASLGTPSGELTEARAEALLDSAYRVLPTSIAEQPYAGHICHVLVYMLEKKAGRRAKIVRNDPLLLPGHLRGAGIAATLGLAW